MFNVKGLRARIVYTRTYILLLYIYFRETTPSVLLLLSRPTNNYNNNFRSYSRHRMKGLRVNGEQWTHMCSRVMRSCLLSKYAFKDLLIIITVTVCTEYVLFILYTYKYISKRIDTSIDPYPYYACVPAIIVSKIE